MNGRYILVMQFDGDLVLYEGVQSRDQAIWATNTSDIAPSLRPNRAEMDNDGSFVLYNNLNAPVWASGTEGHPGSTLVVQDDANVVIYDSSNDPLWACRPLPTKEQEVPEEDVRDVTRPVRIDTGREEVAWGQYMRTTGWLYSNGSLVIQIECKNNHPASGLRPQVVCVVHDAAGNMIWISNVLSDGRTYCASIDPSCPSSGLGPAIGQSFPLTIGQHAVGVDVFQFDGPQSQTFRRNTCNLLKAGESQLPEPIRQPVRDILRC